MDHFKGVICLFVVFLLVLQPVMAESATGNISGRIVFSTSSSTNSSTNSASTSSEVGGGGCGGGPPLFNSTFSNAFAVSRYIYEENKEIPLKLADVYTNATDIVNVSIVVDSPLYIDFRFANVIRLPGIDMPENAYRVYEFVFTKFGTRTKVEPKSAIVTFRVANSWIKKAEDVRLFEYQNGSWVEHSTQMLGAKDNFTYFKSSFNHSGFYYLGYPEPKPVESAKEGAENTSSSLNESLSYQNSTQSTQINQTSVTNQTTNQTANQTTQNNTLNTIAGAIQESLVGDILNDIVTFFGNLINSIRSFLGF